VFGRILSSKWMSLFCTFINSTFASIAWEHGDHFTALLCFALAFYCGYNFIIGVKEDYYDQGK
jgi:hypothetical protein